MKYNYPHTGNDKLMFQERFWSPAYVASNGGTVTGSLSFNNGAVFDGTAKYVSYLRKDHGFPAQWTLFAEVIKGIQTSQFTIFSRWGTTAATQQFCLSITAGGSLKLDVQWTDGTSTSLTDTVNGIDIGQKCQVAATYDGTTIRLFVNGVAGSTVAVASKRLRRTTTAFRVGATANTGSEYYFKGTITEIRQYGMVLSQSDLQNLGAEAIAYNGLLWNPANIEGCLLYTGSFLESRATRAIQPSIIDSDMEAVGTAAWTGLYAGTVLSKESGTRTGGSGTKVIRVTNANMGSAAQALGGAGLREIHKVWVRASDTVNGEISSQTSETPITFTATTNWSLAQGETTFAGGTWRDLKKHAGGSWMEFDDWTIDRLSITSYSPIYTTAAGSVLSQLTTTAMPWVSSDGFGIRYQAGDLLQWTANKSFCKCLHDGTGGTLILVIRPSSVVGTDYFASTSALGASNVGIGFFYTATSIGVLGMNGSGTYNMNSSGAVSISSGNTYVITYRALAGINGVTVRVNGSNKITTTLLSPSSSNPTDGLRLGTYQAGAGTFDGVLGHTFLANRVLTDAECTLVENYILSRVA